MERVLPYSVDRCESILVMPNTDPPILTAQDVEDYRYRIRKKCGDINPMMTFKLTEQTTPETIRKLVNTHVIAGKLYPEGVTTNSTGGISRQTLEKPGEQFLSVLSEMEQHGIVLCMHGELPNEYCLDRESKFLFFVEYVVKTFPRLKVVLEHISTKDSVDLVTAYSKKTRNLAATITLHHLLMTTDDVAGDKLMPHNFCKPLAKRPEDRDALLDAAFSGNPQFFFGSDSAPHERTKKESYECCAGCFTAPVMLEMLVELFDRRDKMKVMEGFTSDFAAGFYNLRKSKKEVRVVKDQWRVPVRCNGVVPWWANKQVAWRT